MMALMCVLQLILTMLTKKRFLIHGLADEIRLKSM